jgi:hypothetical protein
VHNLSSVSGTTSEKGVQPDAAIDSEISRFGPMSVTGNVTL